MEDTDSESIEFREEANECICIGKSREHKGKSSLSVIYTEKPTDNDDRFSYAYLLRQKCQIYYDYEFYENESVLVNNLKYYAFKCFSDFKIYDTSDVHLGTITHNFPKTEFKLTVNKEEIATIHFKYQKLMGKPTRIAHVTHKAEANDTDNGKVIYFLYGRTANTIRNENNEVLYYRGKDFEIVNLLIQEKVLVSMQNIDFDIFSLFFAKNISPLKAVFYGICNWEAK